MTWIRQNLDFDKFLPEVLKMRIAHLSHTEGSLKSGHKIVHHRDISELRGLNHWTVKELIYWCLFEVLKVKNDLDG